jgi:hypothetical protein
MVREGKPVITGIKFHGVQAGIPDKPTQIFLFIPVIVPTACAHK